MANVKFLLAISYPLVAEFFDCEQKKLRTLQAKNIWIAIIV